MGLSLGNNPTGPESAVDASISLNEHLHLESDDGTISFSGFVGGSLEGTELFFNGQLSYLEDGTSQGSTLFHRVYFVDEADSKVATLSKYPNSPHPVVTVTFDRVSSELTMQILHQDLDAIDRGNGTFRI